MSAIPAAKTPVISPSRLGRYLEKKLFDDRRLHHVGVQGEVSNLRVQGNGNVYFSLKDRDAVLSCVAFAERAVEFPAVENGADVIAYGEVKIYAKTSIYQLVATRLERAGVGALHAKYEELSRKLQRDGLFDAARKRPLPRYPFRVALVGSPTGEGTRDFLIQARERAPHVRVRLFETPVNGVAAVPDVVRAIAAADGAGADLLIVVRGGGSYEDLFGFSDERVVRAIAGCRTATVAAIGHERDQPLIELAADARASTPSTAAQTVLPRRDDLLRAVVVDAGALRRAFAVRFERARAALERIERRSPVADPARLLAGRRQAVDTLHVALGVGIERRVARCRARLPPLERGLNARSPRALLERRCGRVAQLAALLARVREQPARWRRTELAPLAARLRRGSPALAGRRKVLAVFADRLAAAFGRSLERRCDRFATLVTRLDGSDPEALLQRGYAIVSLGGRPLRDAADAPPGTRIEARLARGTLRARVERDGANGGEQVELF